MRVLGAVRGECGHKDQGMNKSVGLSPPLRAFDSKELEGGNVTAGERPRKAS